MNSRQLLKLGVPQYCLKTAMTAIQQAVANEKIRGKEVKARVQQVIATPEDFLEDAAFGTLAAELVEDNTEEVVEPIDYQIWGKEGIDEGAFAQMEQACQVPAAYGAALMPDAHIGYGLPIGGVLALENAVIPYAVGVDIACRMKLSVLDTAVDTLDDKRHQFIDALNRGTVFGVGTAHEKKQHHSVMDQDWTVTKVTRQNKDKAWKQLGSSGSGNHFVEFGVLTITEDDAELGLSAGEYVALLSHSGSRGTGASVCSTYSSIAQSRLKKRHQYLGRLAWLDMDSEAGQEYWAAMNLMGDYAAANHAVIHKNVAALLGSKVISGVENHHNFAWKEEHGGQEVYVHRKGATPAAAGEMGVIPGSMADPAFVVRGKGNPASLNSASHGAGRCMSRNKAKDKYRWKAVKNDLEKRGITVISAGADEVPGVYKNINEVMAEQQDLVEIVARFNPKVVKMCGDGSRAED
ncbi:RNA-splicing ligase RtcB [Gimesia panareensis]|uniref:3'-phosphate/5'-hydroxy nucleic acid ligase n=1 Tax=Gimesia panareensis TaxID=2527978 RepID=A0A518FNA6_9PLAN|nr:RtcB family protein [Gimesia panareensis]QDV17824.1 RNA-splicing ligase RtcB [Gimesia panareensis]